MSKTTHTTKSFRYLEDGWANSQVGLIGIERLPGSVYAWITKKSPRIGWLSILLLRPATGGDGFYRPRSKAWFWKLGSLSLHFDLEAKALPFRDYLAGHKVSSPNLIATAITNEANGFTILPAFITTPTRYAPKSFLSPMASPSL